MKTIYFVRHGESRANIEKVYAGSRYDSPLTELGLQQAVATAAKFRGVPIDIIVSSPLVRAKTTAERIAGLLSYDGAIWTNPLLSERDFGAASGKYWADIAGQVDNGEVEDLETVDQLADRMRRLLMWLRTLEANHILAVGHGTAEAMLQTIYQQRPPHTFLQTRELGNAEVREYHI